MLFFIKKLFSFFLIKLYIFALRIPLPLDIKEIASNIFVLPDPFFPNKIFTLLSKEDL